MVVLGDDYKQYYRRIAAHFDDIRLDREGEIADTIRVLGAYITPGEGRLLDVGCGTGRYVRTLVTMGYDAWGLDISFDQLCHTCDPARMVCARCTSIPFADRSFMGALSVLLLHQLTCQERSLLFGELHRVLNEVGIYIIKTSSHEDLRRRPLGEYFPSALGINLTRYPDVALLRQELQSAGFRVLEVVPSRSEQRLAAADLIKSVALKHNTTLELIPPEEFDKGLANLTADMSLLDHLTISHFHTMIIGSRS